MGKRLYIIGNGFDLHHRIPSAYWQFGEYLKANDQDVYENVERYFTVDEQFWSEFEARLADFDIDTLTDDASNFLESYGAEDWSDAYHHSYQMAVGDVVEAISKSMRLRFADWIRSLPIPTTSAIVGLRLPIDRSATFLNFNYTSSLQTLYGVADEQILFIHGSVKDPAADLVLGHGRRPPPNLDPYRYERDPEAADVRVVEGQQIIDRYFEETFKPTAEILAKSASFFRSLFDVEEIFVLGHSMSEVDHPYLLEVMRNVDLTKVRWTISYRGDVTSVRQQADALGISSRRTTYVQLLDIST